MFSMMSSFPIADPIPLPAPVWLFKFLHDLTLSLHFVFLYLMLGGLMLAFFWNLIGHLTKSQNCIAASGVVINRIPIVMTFVINLGVPPLLFTQLLYGQALYTSSILIGVYWISVIFSIIAAYGLLYVGGSRAVAKKAWWGWAFLSLVLLLYVGKIYSTNMTLMLRPEVWPEMYAATATGIYFPPFDPTRTPRYVMMMVAALGFGALGTTFYSSKPVLTEEVKGFLRVWGGRVALAALLALGGIGLWNYRVQPDFVKEGLLASPLYKPCFAVWFAGLGLSVAFAFLIQARPKALSAVTAYGAALSSILAIGALVVLRGGVRDITLAHKGLNVWQSAVNTNWLVVGLFIGSLLAGVLGLFWLLRVVRSAKPAEENYV